MHTSPKKWRLLLTQPAPGVWNMAVDEAILETARSGEVAPTLRLYAWNPPCLSIGYAQPAADADCSNLQKLGWDIVRRPTGGRAILHTDELTYSVIGPQSHPALTGGVLESYQRISKALLQALHRLNIPAQARPQTLSPIDSDANGPVCFEIPSNYEITVKGKKLIGSAQARRRESILQHGSLPLHGDLTRITQALSFASQKDRSNASERLLARATTVEAVLGYVVSWDTAAQAFADAFRQVLGLDLEPAGLTPSELSRADELVHTKYDHPSWTMRI